MLDVNLVTVIVEYELESIVCIQWLYKTTNRILVIMPIDLFFQIYYYALELTLMLALLQLGCFHCLSLTLHYCKIEICAHDFQPYCNTIWKRLARRIDGASGDILSSFCRPPRSETKENHIGWRAVIMGSIPWKKVMERTWKTYIDQLAEETGFRTDELATVMKIEMEGG